MKEFSGCEVGIVAKCRGRHLVGGCVCVSVRLLRLLLRSLFAPKVIESESTANTQREAIFWSDLQ